MADSFEHWLAYLFLSPNVETWSSGFDDLLAGWQLEACHRLLNEAKRHADEHPEWIPRIQTCEARWWLQRGDWARAEVNYYAALDALDDDDERELYHITADLGLIQRLRGELNKALHNHHLCLTLAAQNGWRAGEAESHIQLGLDYEMMGDLRQAEQQLLQAERLYRELDDPVQIALTRKSLALIVIGLRQYERARELLIEALPILEAQNELLHVAQAYGNLGNLTVHAEEFEAARGWYRQALERFQALDAQLEICGLLNNLAGIAYYEERYAEASELYAEALQRARDLGSASDERNTLMNLALLHMQQSSYGEAARICRAALRLSYRLGDRRMVFQLVGRWLRLQLILVLKRWT